MDRLEALFRNLDRWRHLPNYELERRADIFFSIYLVDLIAGSAPYALASYQSHRLYLRKASCFTVTAIKSMK